MSDTVVHKKSRLSQVSLIFACGTALFSDGYANGVIGPVGTILNRIYGADKLAENDYSNTVSSVAFAGTVVGMLTFGYLSDKIGRKFGMMSATLIVALFSALSAASSGAHHSLGGMLAMLAACRFLLGIGVGAEYPCGSVAASEQSEEPGVNKNAQHRWFALATNSMIDFGFVVSAFVPLVLLWIFKENHLRAVWRVSLGLGVVPALAVLLWRLRMEEPTRYKEGAMRGKVPYWLIIKRYWVSLAAISATWFIYDFIVYPFGIYTTTVVDTITHGSDALTTTLGWGVVINLFYMPGTIGGAFVVDYLGPKYTMILGLCAQAVIGFIMSGLYKKLTENIAAFAVVYGIFLSFGELGPGNCLGMLAAKSGPTAVRGQFYGIAAAIGKIGAFGGTWAFKQIILDFGGPNSEKANTGPFWIGSGLAIFSALITLFFIKPLSHDGMEIEDAKFREYLQQHGYDVSQMGLPGSETTSIDSANEKEAEKDKNVSTTVSAA